MNREDIIRMAREAGGCDIASHGWVSWVGTQSTEFLERFFNLAIAAEREACAKVCEELGRGHGSAFAEYDCAVAIRMRGEK